MIEERQQDRAFVDNGHTHAEGCEHCGIFHADHTRPDHNQRTGNFTHVQYVIADHNALTVKSDMAVTRGVGAAGKDHFVGLDDVLFLAAVFQFDMVGIDKRGVGFDQLYAVTGQLVADDVDFAANDMLDPK